jgi:hypothetical protein
MIDELIEKISIKPILEEPPQKQFEVKYFTDRENDVPFEEYKEFNMDLFRGKLISKHLELVSSDKEERYYEERKESFSEEEEEEEKIEEEVEKPLVKSKQVKIDKSEVDFVNKSQIATIARNKWKINGEDITSQLPPPVEYKLPVSPFFMNNREAFVQFINTHFKEYKIKLGKGEDVTCENLQNDENNFSALNHQKIIRDYLNLYTPYRGLLVFHSLGAGKTASSIVVAEGLKNSKQVYILTPASLEKNYKTELKKAGDPLYRVNQCWEWIPVDHDTDRTTIDSLSTILNLPISYIVENHGAWLVNTNKNYNCNQLGKKEPFIQKSQSEMASLNKQIDMMIDAKYKFIHYNGLTKRKFNELTDNLQRNIFDNSAIVIDEAHNLISRIVNKISKEKEKPSENFAFRSVALNMYHMLLSAKNCKIVLLSGTPIINYPNEIGILFNILRGYIYTWNIQIKTSNPISKEKLEKMLFTNYGVTDYIDFDNSKKLLTITRNPFGFINKISREYKGVSLTGDYISDDSFERIVRGTLKKENIEITAIEKIKFKALPDKIEDFERLFVNYDNGLKLTNTHLFQRRILGLTSYYRSEQEKLLPRYNVETDLHVIEIPMSNFQFEKYESARVNERKTEESNKKKSGKKKPINENELFKEPTSTYRIFSRQFCNFVMPNEIGRPQPDMKEEIAVEINDEKEDEAEGDEIVNEVGGREYVVRIQRALRNLSEHSSEYLNERALEKYSPKFLKMLENIKRHDNIGLNLVYSQFRTMEGIEIFKLVLLQNGFREFRIKSLGQGQWDLDFPRENFSLPMFALYTGTEDYEQREMIRLIFNGEWDKIPILIADKLREYSPNNNLGEIIKVLMITASGSEGINLRNTRYVHLMEPYWHPVRLEQVIGRARRICSHKNLDYSLQTVEAFIYLMEFTQEQIDREDSNELRKKDLSKRKFSISGKLEYIPLTSDEALFEISEIKKEFNNQINKAIKEASIDCQLYQEGSTERLNCIRFGTSSNKFSYIPDIKKEAKDETAKLNKEKDVLTGLDEIKFKGKVFVRRQIGPTIKGEMIYELFDKDSYLRVKEDPSNYLQKRYTLLITKTKPIILENGEKIRLENGEIYEVNDI